MRALSCALIVFGLLLSRLAADDFKPEAGFTLLFNGRNLDGWKTARVKDGAEALDGKPEAHGGRFKVAAGILTYDPAVKGDRYIETAREFAKDVHIKLDFNPGPKCNNDFFLRGTKFDIVPGKKETEGVREGEWQTLEIIVQGDKVEHRIDGKTVRTSKAGSAATPLMLRAEFGAIQLRNIRVKD